MIPAAAILAECERRSYLETQVLPILALAIDEDWTDIPAGFFQQLDNQAHLTIDPWYNLAHLRGHPAPEWQDFKSLLYRHIRAAKDIYDGKSLMTSKDDYARAIIAEGQRRHITERGIVIALATTLVESGLVMYANAKVPASMSIPHEAVGSDGLSVGLFQQQVRDDGNGWWWGDAATCMDPTKSAGLFYDRLARLDYNGSNSPGSYAQAVQDSAYPDRYDQRMSDAQAIYDRLATGGPTVGWTGDPVWLEDVLRPALGDRLKTMPGWQDSGHGDFQDIRGVMVHHTGNGRATAQSIRDGRPDLPGPVSNLHIAQDGTVTIVAVGVCWHAGQGSYPWLPTDNGNWHLIGIECAWPMDTSITPATQTSERWPDAQIISMRDTCAALAAKLGVGADHVIGHKEYAGAAQGKWDPGNLDMNWFRGEVAKDMRGEFDQPAPAPQPGGPPVPNVPDYTHETFDQVRGRWAMLGDQTMVEALAQIRDKVCGTTDAGKTGVRFD